MTRKLVVAVCALALAPSALAQNKITGSLDCDKGEPRYVLADPDREGFAFVLDQNKCTWTKHTPIEGLQAKAFVNTRFAEVTGAAARTTAVGATLYDNGDKLYTRSTGATELKALTSRGDWTISGGTGKLSGIKGGGTYTCKLKSAEPGAGYTCEVEGKYTLPAAKKK